MNPHADFLTLTTSPESRAELLAGLCPVLDAAGGSVEVHDECRSLYRLGVGSILLQTKYGVFQASASGDALGRLRHAGLFGEYLAALSTVPHRVTRLDAALDLSTDAPPIIRSIWRRAAAGRIALTFKRVPGANCSKHISPGLDGRETGTVYVGTPQAEVRAAVYDKRQQIFARTGADVGPRVRFELRMKSGVGVTLADAHAPGPVFWHYAAPGLLERPLGVQPWVPHAEGFVMPERAHFTPAQLMDRKLEGSADVRRLLELAEEIGPLGVDFLCQKIRRLARYGAETSPGRSESAEAVSAVRPPLQ